MQPDTTQPKVKKTGGSRPGFFHDQKRYFALFKPNGNAIEVEFPDLPGCETSGSNWEEAIANATTALSSWLTSGQATNIQEPSTRQSLEHLNGDLIPISAGEKV